MDVIKDHCSEKKDKHLSFSQSDTRLILGAWAHLLCLTGLLNNIQNSVGSAWDEEGVESGHGRISLPVQN